MTSNEINELFDDDLEGKNYLAVKTDSSLTPYISGKLMKLTELTNEILVERYQGGDQESLAALVLKNEKLVMSRAHYFYRQKSSADFEDLIQSGMMGLIHAAGKFDVDLGYKFTTYAYNWIDKYIRSAIRNADEDIRIPPKKMQRIRLIRKMQEENPQFTEEELKNALMDQGMSEEEYDDLHYIMINQLSTASLNSPIGDEGDTVELMDMTVDDKTPDVEEQIINKSENEYVGDLIDQLNEREQYIITKRFGLDGNKTMTLEELGDKLDISKERVRQIQNQAVKKMREFAKNSEG